MHPHAVGRVREQPAREVLHDHGSRSEAGRRGSGALESDRRSGGTVPQAGWGTIMTTRTLMARLREVFQRSAIERETDDELVLHRDLLTAEYERQGLGAHEARRRALLRLGGLDQGKEAI